MDRVIAANQSGNVAHLFSGIVRKKKPIVKIGGVIIGTLILFASSYYRIVLSNVLGLLVIWAVFLEKENILNDKGALIYYDMKLTNYADLWTWDEITSLHWEKQEKQGLVRLHIGKGPMTRLFTFKEQDLTGILALVKRMNSRIIIAEVDRKR